MDKARLQAYVNLIEQLLTCADGEVLNNILQANQELIDLQFLQEMENYASGLEEQGNNNPAAWLRNMARQLAETLGLSKDKMIATRKLPKDYPRFLMEVLQKIRENDNPQIIYPFLAKNLDKLDEDFLELLDIWAKNTLPSDDKERDFFIAGIVFSFSNLIREFPLGSVATNLEVAITGYHIALSVFTFNIFPQGWACTQNNSCCK